MPIRKAKKLKPSHWDIIEINGVKYRAGIAPAQFAELDRWVYPFDEKAHDLPLKDGAKYIARANKRIEESR